MSALLLTYAVLLAALVIAPVSWGPRATAAEPDLQVELEAVSPAIAGPGVEVRVTGSVTNLGPQPVPVHSIRVSTAHRGLDSRAAVAEWADEGSGTTPVTVAEDEIGSMVAPGARVRFFAMVSPDALDPGFAFATLPVRVEVMSDPESDDPTQDTAEIGAELRTFLPWQAADEDSFQPVQIAWVAPLTLPGGAELVAPDPDVRSAAWSTAIGPESRTTALLDGLADTEAALLVDPALLAPLDPVGSLTEGVVPPGVTPEEPPGEDPTTQPTPESTEVPNVPAPRPPPATSTPGSGTPGSGTPGSATPGSATPGSATPGSGAPGSGAPTPSPVDPSSQTPGATTTSNDDGVAPTATNAGEGNDFDGVTSTTQNDDQPPQIPSVPSTPASTEEAVDALRSRLEQVPEDRLWWLPVGDTDTGALIELGTSAADLAALLARPSAEVVADLAALPGRTDITWPLWTDPTDEGIAILADAWRQSGDATGGETGDATGGEAGGEAGGESALSAVVLPLSAIADEPPTSSAVRPHQSGPLLIGYDERLSAVVAASGGGSAGGSAQRFLAETLAIYQQQPAAERSVVVAIPRSAAPAAETLQAITDSSASAPWLSEVRVTDLMSRASTDSMTVTLEGTPQAEPGGDRAPAGEGDPAAYLIPGASPLTPHRVSKVEEVRVRLTGASEIVPGTAQSLATWEQVLDRQYSARWRQGAAQWSVPLDRAQSMAREILDGLSINPTTINFLADEGVIRITVSNNLPVQIDGLRMNVSPGNARLRVLAQPDPITIGPDSRATVQFNARAMASGQVPLNTSLTTPNGTLVGEIEETQVRVQPTGVWIYWLLGGVAGVILVLGLVRALRPRPGDGTTVATPGSDTEST